MIYNNIALNALILLFTRNIEFQTLLGLTLPQNIQETWLK